MRFGALALAAPLAWAAVARADEPAGDGVPTAVSSGERSSSLSWVRLEGAEGCIGGAALARGVEERLGRRVFVSAAEAELVVEGRAERTAEPPGFRAVISLTDRDGTALGERVVERAGETCEALGPLVAVAIAVMIDPLTPPGPEEPPPRVIVKTRRIVVQRRGPRWGLGVEGTLGAALGLLPGLSGGGQGDFVLTPPRFMPIVVSGALFVAQNDQATFLQAHGGLALCPLVLGKGRVGLVGCAGVEGGGVFAQGRNGAASADRLIGQAHLTVRLRWRLVGPLELRTGLALVVPFRHDELERLYTPDPVAGIFSLGLGLQWGS